MLRFVCFALLLAITGCSDDQLPDDDTGIIKAVVIENLGRGNSGSLSDTTEAVYRTLSEWHIASEGLSPLEPFPEYDTSQVMILLAAIPTNSGGYSVQFETVEETSTELIATYEFNVPGHDCLTVTAISLAFQAVKIPRSDLPVRFVQEERPFSCSA